MQINIAFTIPQVAILNPAKTLHILREEVGRGMVRIVEPIATSARAQAPVDRGILRASIFTEVKPGAGTTLVHATVGTGRQAPYAADVEYGTPPHWITDIEPLKGWAKRVLGDENAAYAVRHAIAKRGTKPQPYFIPAVEHMRPQIPAIMQTAVALAVARLEQP